MKGGFPYLVGRYGTYPLTHSPTYLPQAPHTWRSYPAAGIPGARPPRTAGPHSLPVLQRLIALTSTRQQQ